MRYETLTKKHLIKRIKTKRKAPCRPYSRMNKQELINHLRLLNVNAFASKKKTKKTKRPKRPKRKKRGGRDTR